MPAAQKAVSPRRREPGTDLGSIPVAPIRRESGVLTDVYQPVCADHSPGPRRASGPATRSGQTIVPLKRFVPWEVGENAPGGDARTPEQPTATTTTAVPATTSPPATTAVPTTTVAPATTAAVSTTAVPATVTSWLPPARQAPEPFLVRAVFGAVFSKKGRYSAFKRRNESPSTGNGRGRRA